ncbi:GGDEF domain-containing protein [Chitinimonas arctica]|nr:GGDEF domain-containing protein [Chitinimonas arctica]
MSYPDISTLILAESLMLLQLAALVFVTGIRVQGVMQGPRAWSIGLLAYALAEFSFTIVLKGSPQAAFLPDLLATIGCGAFIIGLDDFADRPRRWPLIMTMLGVHVVSLYAFSVLWPSYHARLMVFSAMQVIFCAAVLISLTMRVQPQRRLGLSLFRSLAYGWSVINMLRMALALVFPLEGSELHHLRELIFYVLVLFFGIWLALGCLLLIHERIASDLLYATKMDLLTNCLNRRGFTEALQLEKRRLVRSWMPTSILAIEIDLFAELVDKHGQESADEALMQFAKVVREELRDVDGFARMGGESFAVLLLDADRAGAHKVAERLRRRVEDLVLYTASGPLWFTVSIGVAGLPPVTFELENTLEEAQQALIAAKQAGCNVVALAEGRLPANA